MTNLYFNAMSFIDNLKYMGVGMIGVFMIVGIIIAATCLVGYATKKNSSNKNDRK